MDCTKEVAMQSIPTACTSVIITCYHHLAFILYI